MQVGKEFLKAHRDFELCSHRDREISYFYAVPEKAKGLVVFVPGFGDDSTDEYQEKFVTYIAKTFGFSCISVNYIGKKSRPGKDVMIHVPAPVERLLRSLLDDFSSPIHVIVEKAKLLRLNIEKPVIIPCVILPKTEYQKFGLLPALDVIFSVVDYFQKYKDTPHKVILIGSSYGGYVCNLVAKFAPSSVSAVFDNSSWAKVKKHYINGIEMGSYEYVQLHGRDIRFEMSLVTPWTNLFGQLPTYLSEDRIMIREFPPEHLRIVKANGGSNILFFFVHSKYDHIAPVDEKREFFNNLLSMGFKAHMDIYDENLIDGKYIKNMNHGMGMSLRELFRRAYDRFEGEIPERSAFDFEQDREIRFPCNELTYIFEYEAKRGFPHVYLEGNL